MQKAGHQAGTWPLAWDARQGRRRAEDSLASSRAGCLLLAGSSVLPSPGIRLGQGRPSSNQARPGYLVFQGFMPLCPSPLASTVLVCLNSNISRPSSTTLGAGEQPQLDMPWASRRPMCEGRRPARCVVAWQPGSVQEMGWGAARGRDQDSPGSWLQQGSASFKSGVPDGLTLQGVLRHVDGARC